MKKCNRCNLDKPYDQFYKRSALKDGYQKLCKVCKAIMDKKRYAQPEVKEKQYKSSKNRRVLNRQRLYDFMKDKKCIKCGEIDIACLHFDHRNPEEKKFNIANLSSLAWETVMNEINKCDILCANCHCKRTAKQFNWYKDLK